MGAGSESLASDDGFDGQMDCVPVLVVVNDEAECVQCVRRDAALVCCHAAPNRLNARAQTTATTPIA